jgi:protein-ribulosamine 3-kinase
MMEGSYESEKIFHHYSPTHVPRPVAWGAYAADPNMWYYICDFHEMEDGKYGFHVPTHLANLPNDNTWQTSWETWYAQAMRKMFELEEVAHGKDPKLESLKKDLYDKVIPRLLRPLETGGRSIQPCLVHSDLWPGNIKPDADTNEIMIFDSCAFWGHNEADLGTWRAPRYKFGRPFVKEYQKAMGISEPRGDWDDRNALYAMYVC